MKTLVTLNDRQAILTHEQKDDQFVFTFEPKDGDPVGRTASVVEVEPGIYSVLVEGRSYDVKVIEGRNALSVGLCGHHLQVEVRDPRAISASRQRGAGEGRIQIAAPMPGKVVRVLVQPGDPVEAAQGLVVVEAMKMQNEMKSPKAGTVVEVRTKEGATVTAGEILVVVE
jgi:biotin carboxyl carrier protein